MPINYFFEGLDEPSVREGDGQGAERTIQGFLRTSEGIELARLFPRIAKGPLRRRVLDLVRAAALDAADAESEG